MAKFHVNQCKIFDFLTTTKPWLVNHRCGAVCNQVHLMALAMGSSNATDVAKAGSHIELAANELLSQGSKTRQCLELLSPSMLQVSRFGHWLIAKCHVFSHQHIQSYLMACWELVQRQTSNFSNCTHSAVIHMGNPSSSFSISH